MLHNNKAKEGTVSLPEILKNKKVRAICYGLLLSLICQIYISPFAYPSYVVSLGTPALNALLLFVPDLPVFLLTIVMAASASFLRGVIGVSTSGLAFTDMFIPALIYYVLYSLMLSGTFKILKEQKKFRLMLGMIFCDFAANALQLILIGHMEGEAVIDAALVSVIRGILVWAIYRMYEWELLYIRKKEHQLHYAQLNSIVSDIYAESFYLQKSMEDLNKLTRKSHQLYEDMESQGQEGQEALDIAREAHEIRKDYQRIYQGISALVHAHEEKSLRLSYILQIIKDNTKRQIEDRGRKISLRVQYQTDMQIQHYYDLFTILNNLLINSIDACNENGHITLSVEEHDGVLRLQVTDDGCGMDEDMLKYIWGAGFSTKYDETTGQMSTGIGLCHVANVVEHLDGTAEVKSAPSKGTQFNILLPIEKLR